MESISLNEASADTSNITEAEMAYYGYEELNKPSSEFNSKDVYLEHVLPNHAAKTLAAKLPHKRLSV